MTTKTKGEYKNNKGEYREFRDLLRRGIGTRTQKAFAEEVDISKEHLNRLLNNKEISRPSEVLLKKMAAHMRTVTERMLLESCGYQPEPIANRVKQLEDALSGGLHHLVERTGSRPWQSVLDALQTVDTLYLTESGRLRCEEEKACTEDNWAEREVSFSYDWTDGEHVCRTSGTVYFSRTEMGNVFFLDYRVNGTRVMDKEEAEKKAKAGRWLQALLADWDAPTMVSTFSGYGFHYPKTPEGFVDFLCEYRGLFCTTKERSRMFLRLVDEGADPDEVFDGFSTDCGGGTGGTVAEILTKLLGVSFCFHRHDERLSEEESPACVFADDEGDLFAPGEDKSQFLLGLHHVAEVLQIPQFGYFPYAMYIPVDIHMYDTKSFGYEFPKAD